MGSRHGYICARPSYLLQFSNGCVHINLNCDRFKAVCLSGHALLPVHGPFVFLYPGLQCDLDSFCALPSAQSVYQTDCASRHQLRSYKPCLELSTGEAQHLMLCWHSCNKVTSIKIKDVTPLAGRSDPGRNARKPLALRLPVRSASSSLRSATSMWLYTNIGEIAPSQRRKIGIGFPACCSRSTLRTMTDLLKWHRSTPMRQALPCLTLPASTADVPCLLVM